MWFLILVVAVVVGLVAIGVRSDLRRRRRARLLGDDQPALGSRAESNPGKVDLDQFSAARLRETRDAPWNGGMY
jgi:hypothetical protein